MEEARGKIIEAFGEAKEAEQKTKEDFKNFLTNIKSACKYKDNEADENEKSHTLAQMFATNKDQDGYKKVKLYGSENVRNIYEELLEIAYEYEVNINDVFEDGLDLFNEDFWGDIKVENGSIENLHSDDDVNLSKERKNFLSKFCQKPDKIAWLKVVTRRESFICEEDLVDNPSDTNLVVQKNITPEESKSEEEESEESNINFVEEEDVNSEQFLAKEHNNVSREEITNAIAAKEKRKVLSPKFKAWLWFGFAVVIAAASVALAILTCGGSLFGFKLSGIAATLSVSTKTAIAIGASSSAVTAVSAVTVGYCGGYANVKEVMKKSVDSVDDSSNKVGRKAVETQLIPITREDENKEKSQCGCWCWRQQIIDDAKNGAKVYNKSLSSAIKPQQIQNSYGH